MEFNKWRSIGKFSDVYKTCFKHGVSKLSYNAKIKLHGTNCGIQFNKNGTLSAQGRNRYLTAENDHYAFAKFVLDLKPNKNSEYFQKELTIFGEWAGKGIQKGDAVCSGPKMFYVFALDINGRIESEPDIIESILEDSFGGISWLKIIPWFYEKNIDVDILNLDAAEIFITKVTKDVDEIAQLDPYIQKLYNVAGDGEGLVFTARSHNSKEPDSLWMFKQKSEKHSQNKSRRERVLPQKAEGVDEFVDIFITENRLLQMVRENELTPDKKNTGAFLKVVMLDIYKESKNEIEAADFEWQDVTKYLTNSAKVWWLNRCDDIFQDG